MLLRKCLSLSNISRYSTRNLNQKITARHLIVRSISSSCYLRNQIHDFEVSDNKIQKYLENIRLEYYGLQVSDNVDKSGRKRMLMISHIVEMYEQRKIILENIKSLNEMKHDDDEDMKNLMKEENEVYKNILERLDKEIMMGILTMDEEEDYNSLILEVTAGVGGQEAMLFARDLYTMYCNYIDYKGWQWEILQEGDSDVGGIRHVSAIVTGREAYKHLKFEAGVHRVQRIPTTEKSGRIHTSTVTVAIIPKPDDFELNIKDKDLKIETKRASGAGGQHVNTTDSAVRIVHLPTGIAVESQSDRSQIRNRSIALERLKAKIMQKELEEQFNISQTIRKSQVGQSNRNEKIRTYNFNQDRITDHRIENGTIHNVKGFLDGGVQLNDMISKLSLSNRKKQLLEIINNTIAIENKQ